MLDTLHSKFLIRVAKAARVSRDVIKDIDYWKERYAPPDEIKSADAIWWYFRRIPEFRSIYYYRTRKGGARVQLIVRVLRIMYPSLVHLYIHTSKIGGGLFIQHGHSTQIVAKSIGERCQINQNVTIGYGSIEPDSNPTIGNNVRIHTGAIIFGNIVIGDGAWIGAGSVVNRNVPENSVVVGNPGRIVRLNGRKVDLPLGHYE
ncbi:MAG: serine acetyltransferase [Verrucomicrobiota bacterium]